MIKNLIKLFIVLSTFFFSCERIDPIKPDLIIGSSKNVVTIKLDTVIQGIYNTPSDYYIDFDKDGIADLKITSDLCGSLSGSYSSKSIVSCMHSNIKLLGFNTNDTLFTNTDTLIYEENNKISVYIYSSTNCFRKDLNDEIISTSTNSFKISPLNDNDEINLEGNFESTSFVLCGDSFSSPFIPFFENSDTIKYEKTERYNDCFAFPLEQIKYIGVLLLNSQKLGWVKLCIFDKYRIILFEYAIQK